MSTATNISPLQSRLFGEFFDPVDMIGTFPAETTVAEVNRRSAEHRLRFPLWTDSRCTLAEHFAVMDYAPASARFGAIVDNVTGMNWELPDGRHVRVGERVIKSATGYDLQRFLLHGDGRYGKATDYVLRLRPIGGETLNGRFTGNEGALEKVRQTLRASSWNHWIDSVNLIIQEVREPQIEVKVDCLPGETRIFQKFFAEVAEKAGASFALLTAAPEVFWPQFSLKCLPGQVAELALRCVDTMGGCARGLLINGAVLVSPGNVLDADLLGGLREIVEPHGGHPLGLASELMPCPVESEKRWIKTLEDAWRNL